MSAEDDQAGNDTQEPGLEQRRELLQVELLASNLQTDEAQRKKLELEHTKLDAEIKGEGERQKRETAERAKTEAETRVINKPWRDPKTMIILVSAGAALLAGSGGFAAWKEGKAEAMLARVDAREAQLALEKKQAKIELTTKQHELELAELKSKKDRQQIEYDKLSEEREGLLRETVQLKGDLKAMRHTESVLEAKISALTEHNAELKQEQANLEDRRARLQRFITSLPPDELNELDEFTACNLNCARDCPYLGPDYDECIDRCGRADGQ